jgi:hypothetical protein
MVIPWEQYKCLPQYTTHINIKIIMLSETSQAESRYTIWFSWYKIQENTDESKARDYKWVLWEVHGEQKRLHRWIRKLWSSKSICYPDYGFCFMGKQKWHIEYVQLMVGQSHLHKVALCWAQTQRKPWHQGDMSSDELFHLKLSCAKYLRTYITS